MEIRPVVDDHRVRGEGRSSAWATKPRRVAELGLGCFHGVGSQLLSEVYQLGDSLGLEEGHRARVSISGVARALA